MNTATTTRYTASQILAAVSSVRYELDPDAATELEGVGHEDGCDAFAAELVAAFPNADVDVVLSSVTASKMRAHGALGAVDFLVALDHMGGVDVSGDIDLSHDAEGDIGEELRRVWERALGA